MEGDVRAPEKAKLCSAMKCNRTEPKTSDMHFPFVPLHCFPPKKKKKKYEEMEEENLSSVVRVPQCLAQHFKHILLRTNYVAYFSALSPQPLA